MMHSTSILSLMITNDTEIQIESSSSSSNRLSTHSDSFVFFSDFFLILREFENFDINVKTVNSKKKKKIFCCSKRPSVCVEDR